MNKTEDKDDLNEIDKLIVDLIRYILYGFSPNSQLTQKQTKSKCAALNYSLQQYTMREKTEIIGKKEETRGREEQI